MVGVEVQSILRWEPDSQTDYEYFRRIPWCDRTISLPGVRAYKGTIPIGTTRGMDPVIHGFMMGEGGILHSVSLLAEPNVFPELGATSMSPTVHDPARQSKQQPVVTSGYPTHIDIFHLGPALHGVPRTIYGGVLALLADGVCGKTAYMHRDPKLQVYTAYTSVRFAKPLVTDKAGTATVLVKSQVSTRSTQGKILVVSSFEGPEGVIYATAESMLVEKAWKEKL
ncbi:hypothetical protein GGR56DRAFT_620765 [Xylariaceae sp. FL0804]|nr:hypothetical protein GGR56DRAFT_620765 [Xylariaceae sp. FL0804]